MRHEACAFPVRVMRLLRILAWVVLCDCRSSPATGQAHVQERTAGSAPVSGVTSATASASAAVAVPGAPPKANPTLFGELASPNEPYFGDERRMGFSEKDDYLGYEISRCDACRTEFHFTSPTEPALDFGYFNDMGNPNAPGAKQQNADVERKLRMLDVHEGNWRKLRGPFPYPDLVFATATDRNDVQGKVSLLFGAHVVGYAPVFPIRVEVGPSPMFGTPMMPSEQARVAALPPDERAKELRAWTNQWLLNDPGVAYANVTHDGSDVGVVAVATGSMWLEMGAVARMSAKAFAGQVYNDTAMRFHHESKFARAAELFEQAEAADPGASLFSYNLACAYARSKDVRARDALARAIQKDGEPIKSRARADKDFAEVSGEAWFTVLVR